MKPTVAIQKIEVKNAHVHNLKNIDVKIPLHQLVVIAGKSGSGKSSLAMGVLYEEGSRRYLQALSTYTRRRIKLGNQAAVTKVSHIPAALALKQRPSIPNERATVGTMSEVFNVVRLIFSRLATISCPNHHKIAPSLAIAMAMSKTGDQMAKITCPQCHQQFRAFSAEDFAFNAAGACQNCHGTGIVRQVDEAKLIKDDHLSLAQGAIASWHLPGRSFMYKVAARAGIDINTPFYQLSQAQKDFVLHGKQQKFTMDLTSSTGRVFHDFNVLYENAKDAVLNSAKSAKSARSQQRIGRFFKTKPCPVCHGSRFKPELLSQTVCGKNIVQVSQMTLLELKHWRENIPATLPENMHQMASGILKEFDEDVAPLLDLGLTYVTLARKGNTLSTGELQRLSLARTLRAHTTGVLYVLDEPSIGLHLKNVTGLIKVLRQLVAQGNSLVVVDHNLQIINQADYLIEIGPGSGKAGGKVIAQGSVAEVKANPHSLIGPYLAKQINLFLPHQASENNKPLSLKVKHFRNLANIALTFPTNQLVAVSGMSGAGKSSLMMDCLMPAITGKNPPATVSVATHLKKVISVDASPVGKNLRSTLATYTQIMNHLRKLFAKTQQAQEKQMTPSDFSYNNKGGACPTCNGNGVVMLDIQFLPDMQEICPTCLGKRYNSAVAAIFWHNKNIPQILAMTVAEAIEWFSRWQNHPAVAAIIRDLQLLKEVGLDYLHLGEATPTLSGGEAQRLKLAAHLHHTQNNSLFIFDEPTIGLHPSDIVVLLRVMFALLRQNASIIVISHDPLLLINSDYLIDVGPAGGAAGGKIVAAGKTAKLLKASTQTATLAGLRQFIRDFSK